MREDERRAYRALAKRTRMLWRSSQGGGTFRYVATGNGGTRDERAAIRAGAQSARMQARMNRHPGWVRYTEVGE